MKTSRYSKIKKQAGIIKKLTGLSVEKFEDTLKLFTPHFIKAEKDRLSKKKRKREPGGGRPQDLNPSDKLLMFLMYNYLFVTHEFLGAVFGLHNSNVSRQIIYIDPLVRKVYEVPERRIKLADAVISHSEIFKIFTELDEAEKEIKVHSIPSHDSEGKDLAVDKERIITKISPVKNITKVSLVQK